MSVKMFPILKKDFLKTEGGKWEATYYQGHPLYGSLFSDTLAIFISLMTHLAVVVFHQT